MSDSIPLDPQPQYARIQDKICKVVWQDQKDRIEAGEFSGKLADFDGNVATRIVTRPTPVYETLEEAERAEPATP